MSVGDIAGWEHFVLIVASRLPDPDISAQQFLADDEGDMSSALQRCVCGKKMTTVQE